jgi:hypothetical protein
MAATHQAIFVYATAEWLQLAPALTDSVESALVDLPAGVTLEESRATVQLDVPRTKSAAPTASQSSLSSPMVPPPLFKLPSTSSANMAPLPHESAPKVTVRSSHTLPACSSYRRVKSSSMEADAPPPPSVALRVVVPRRTTAAPTAPMGELDAPPASSTRSTKKRPAMDLAAVDRPTRILSCVCCKKCKKRCSVIDGDSYPFLSCVLCKVDGEECSWSTNAAGACIFLTFFRFCLLTVLE